MKQPRWMRARVEGRVGEDGTIAADVVEIEPGEGRPPRRVEDIPGADSAVLDRLQHRVPGEFSTWCWPGGATAIAAPWDGLLTLGEPLIKRLEEKYGPWEGTVFLGEVRNTGAPAIWNVAEPSGGMAQRPDLRLEAMLEIVEMGVYQPDGWAAFNVSALAEENYTARVALEQAGWWGRIAPRLECGYELALEPLDIGDDRFNGQPGIVSARREGDLGFLTGARLMLEPGDDWRLRDLEAHFDEQAKQWRMLDRKIIAVVRRHENHSPLMFEFAPDGGLDPCGLHVALSGEAVEYNISHLFRQMLGPHGLGWLIP